MELKNKVLLAIAGSGATFLIGYGELKGEVVRHGAEISSLQKIMTKIDKKVDLLGYKQDLEGQFQKIDKEFEEQ